VFCHHCGSQIADDASTCIHCGVATTPRVAPPRASAPGMAYCRLCGSQIAAEAYVCVHCGARVGGALDPLERALFPEQGRSWVITLLLAIFFGTFGLHRFYVGKIGTGILQLVTFGGLGVWWIIDVIRILLGGFEDGDGRPLAR
jgi:hypothetical protein